jgi:hypothetical protein
LNLRNKFFFNREKSLRQYEKICETAYWQKIRKKGQAHFKSPGQIGALIHPSPLVVGHAYICKVAVGQNISAVIYGS